MTVRKVKGFEYRCDAPMYDAAQIMEDPHDITGLHGVVYEYHKGGGSGPVEWFACSRSHVEHAIDAALRRRYEEV